MAFGRRTMLQTGQFFVVFASIWRLSAWLALSSSLRALRGTGWTLILRQILVGAVGEGLWSSFSTCVYSFYMFLRLSLQALQHGVT